MSINTLREVIVYITNFKEGNMKVYVRMKIDAVEILRKKYSHAKQIKARMS